MNDIFFTILASSSDGNCAYLRANGLNMLIDAGISFSRIQNALAAYGVGMENIDAVFITHDHADHCKALDTLSKKCPTRVFASDVAYDFITYKHPSTKNLKWGVFTGGRSFSFEGMKISTCLVPHDASETVAYKISAGEKTISWITDIGSPTEKAVEFAQSSNVLVLESNYCPKMLENSGRPLKLINRISKGHGHLSNAKAIEVLKTLDLSITERVFLAHISRQCNSVSHIAELLSPLPKSLGERIEIVDPFSCSKRPYIYK